MALQLTYTNEAFPEDHEFSIGNIVRVKNGETTDLDETQERAYISMVGMTVADSVKGNESFIVGGTGSVKVEDVLPSEISDTPSPDPTAMNVDSDGNVFADANLMGKASEPDEVVVEEEVVETTPTTTTTTSTTTSTPPAEGGGS